MSIARGTSYYIIVDGHSWETAESNAISLGGNLVSVNDELESSWLGSEFSKAKYQYSGDDWGSSTINHYWVGGKRKVNGD